MEDQNDPQNLAAATATLSLISKDTTYFLLSIIFQVEDTLFEIPRYHFDRNEVFGATFQMPPPQGEEAEGFSESSPIHLAGISKKDFSAFLGVLYPLTIPPQYNEITTEDWKSVLKLSDMWNFLSVRDLAIRELSTSNRLDPVSKILLGIDHDVSQWLISGCSQLMGRIAGPRVEEARLLGEDLTTLIWDMREQSIWGTVNRCPFDMKACITKAFTSRETTMISSPYFRHALYSLACLSISINLVGMRRFADEDKARASARISILESVKEHLTKSPQLDGDSKELERLMKLAKRTAAATAGGTDKVLGDDVGWSDIFSGKAPKVVGKEEMSRWEREDLEKLRREVR